LPITIMVGRAQISMVKPSRVEQDLSHELGVCLGYAKPRPEYSCFVATARMGIGEAIFPKLLQVDNDRLCWLLHKIGFSSSASGGVFADCAHAARSWRYPPPIPFSAGGGRLGWGAAADGS
jgi:hypothetical protein